MSSDKPREFWIVESEHYDSPPYLDYHRAYHCEQKLFNNVHVIEYSAYQAAQEEMSSLRSENEALKSKLARYEEALKSVVYSLQHQIDDQFVVINVIGFDRARQALGGGE